MPSWPLRVERERQNLPIGGPAPSESPVGLSGMRARGRTSQLEVPHSQNAQLASQVEESKRQNLPIGGPAPSERPVGLSRLRVRGRTSQLEVLHSQNAQSASQIKK